MNICLVIGTRRYRACTGIYLHTPVSVYGGIRTYQKMISDMVTGTISVYTGISI